MSKRLFNEKQLENHRSSVSIRFWSKSGSLLIHNSTHRYLFFNDSNIFIGRTTNLLNFTLTNEFLLETRSTHFDSELVEAGAEPLKLSDGNYLFLYNSARRTNLSQPKLEWHLKYNFGWAILNVENLTELLARSSQPLFSPEPIGKNVTSNRTNGLDVV